MTKRGDILIDSGHTSMMDLRSIDAENYSLLAYSKSSIAYLKGNGRPYFKSSKEQKFYREPEVVYFKNINCLAIQSCYRSEVDKEEEYFKLLKSYLKDMLKNELSLDAV